MASQVCLKDSESQIKFIARKVIAYSRVSSQVVSGNFTLLSAIILVQDLNNQCFNDDVEIVSTKKQNRKVLLLKQRIYFKIRNFCTYIRIYIYLTFITLN